MANFEQNLNVFLPNLPSSEYSGLKQISMFLPSINKGGIEVHLLDSRLDLQLCIKNKEKEIQKLLQLNLPNAYNENILSFANAWRKEWKSDIVEIWLELDSDKLPSIIPSVFVGIKRENFPPSDVKTMIWRSLDYLLGKPLSEKQQYHLSKCVECCPPGVQVTYVGVMLSRATHPIRVNIRGLTDKIVLEYLKAIGFSFENNENKIHDLVSWTLSYVDRITVNLDISEEISPKIGLECFFDKYSPERWTVWLEALGKKGLCAPDAQRTLLSWPGITTPKNTHIPWPEQLIMESLCQPINVFSMFLRQLSHIKLTYSPNMPLFGKGYLWFQHVWGQKTRKDEI